MKKYFLLMIGLLWSVSGDARELSLSGGDSDGTTEQPVKSWIHSEPVQSSINLSGLLDTSVLSKEILNFNALCLTNWKHLTTVDLSNNQLGKSGDDTLKALGLSLQQLEKLTTLKLKDNSLTGAHLEILFPYIPPKLHKITLDNNPLRRLLSFNPSVSLDLKNTNLDDQFLDDLLLALRNKTKLKAQDKPQSKRQSKSWVSSFLRIQTTTYDIRDNKITPDAIVKLATVLENEPETLAGFSVLLPPNLKILTTYNPLKSIYTLHTKIIKEDTLPTQSFIETTSSKAEAPEDSPRTERSKTK